MSEFFIYSKLDSNLVIDIKGAKNAPGTPLQVYKKNYGQNQLWTFVPTLPPGQMPGSDPIGFQSLLDSNLVIDIKGGQAIEHSTLQVNTYSGAIASELWIAEMAPGAPVSIQSNLKHEMVIDVKGRKDASGTPLQIYKTNGGDNQLWSLSALYTASIGDSSQAQLIANPDPPFEMNNSFSITNTGLAFFVWTGFHLTVTNPQVGPPPCFTPTYNGPAGSSYKLSGSSVENIIDISGLNIHRGGTLNFSIDILYGGGGWSLAGIPSGHILQPIPIK